MPAAKPPFPALQRGHPLAQGVVGDWPFYEGSGLTANDVSGRGNSGTFGATTAAPAWAGGQSGWCLSFASASSQYAQIPHSAALNPRAGLTLSLWVRLNSVPAGTATYGLINKSPLGANFGAWDLDVQSTSGHVQMTLNNAAAFFETTAGLVAGAWTHVAATYDGATMRLYLDGVPNNTNAYGGGLAANTDPVYLGLYYQATGISRYLDGSLDSPVIYDRALSAGEIAALYADPFARHRRRSWRLKAAAAGPAPQGWQETESQTLRQRLRENRNVIPY